MNNIKQFEEFNFNSNIRQRIDNFYSNIEKLIEENPPSFNLDFNDSDDIKVNNIKDIINAVKKVPSEILSYIKRLYNSNQDYIDNLALEFKKDEVNEEMCILTLISLGLMALSIYFNRHHIKRLLNKKGYKAKDFIQGYRKGKISSDNSEPNVYSNINKPYSRMTKSELQKALDAALDKRDYDTAKAIGKYIK
jgi:hypothetical protein